MHVTSSNIRSFTTGTMPPDMYTRAIEYVCHERNFYYIYTTSYGLRHFPLLHLDRFASWTYSTGVEPLLARYNGLMAFLDEHVRDCVTTSMDDLHGTLHKIFGQGHKLTVNMWVTHSDGTPYVTSVLLEGMDDQGTVYFTKVNETMNLTCQPMPFDTLVEKVAPEDGVLELFVIRHSPAIDELAAMDGAAAFRHIFADLYGYRWDGGRLFRGDEELTYSLDAFDTLAADLRTSSAEILTSDGVPKHHQFRLNKHIRNRFAPVQFFLEHVRTDPALTPLLPSALAAEVDTVRAEMDGALKDVLKFASLLVQKPVPTMLERHVRAILDLRDLLPRYQAANLGVLRAVTAEKGDRT
jgi:hypothetical protein